MNIDVRIDHLVLDGIDVPPHRQPALQAAVEGELARLLAAGGLAPSLLSGGDVPSVPGGAIQAAGGGDPGALGRQIARAVYGGIGR